MRPAGIWALAVAEFRSAMRLTRTWVFVGIACIASLGRWLYLSESYTFSSLLSPISGLESPRYAMSELGGTMMLWFSVGILFLAFDMRSRDQRDRISEVLDTRPLSDFAIVLGRLVGLVLLLAIPAVTVVLVMFLFGLLAEMFNFGWGTGIEPISVAAFLVWDIFPNLFLWGAVTILASILLKFRFLTVLVLLALMGGAYVLSIVLPYSVSSVLATYTGASVYPSELTPTFVTLDIVLNRGLMIALSVGCLALAAIGQARVQDTKTFVTLLFGGLAALLVVVAGTSSLLIGKEKLNEARVAKWALVHKEHQLHSSTDIQAISGSVEIKPGRSISLDVTLTINTTEDSIEDSLLFSLNPGYRIKEIVVNGTPTDSYEFDSGLLQIPRERDLVPLTVRIVASGKPNERFAYLDSDLDWRKLDAIGVRRLFRLGQKNYIFHPNFIVLTPGTSWFPLSGSAFGRSEWESRREDFFQLDIEVTVPENWAIAGPGTREEIETDRKSTYRLHTQSPVSKLAIVSSKFETRSMTVDGVEYELLLSKKHTENLRTFNGITPMLRDWIGKRTEKLFALGLEYPYDRLSFVEVPTSLRLYGGGWRLDSVYSAPGLQMIRESGFPIAPIEETYRIWAESIPEDLLARMLQVRFDAASKFFSSDLHGGNPLAGIERNFIEYQTAPTGHGATALGHIVSELMLRLSTKTESYFCVHTVLARGTSPSARSYVLSSNTYRTSLVPNWRMEFADRPAVWEILETTPLSSLDYRSDPEASYHALLLKGQLIADAILDTYGEDHIGVLLSELVTRFRGRSYTVEDFHQTALDTGVELDALVGDWLNGFAVPGFLVDNLETERLADNENGESVYQTSFTLVNEESTPGTVKISYQVERREGSLWELFPLDVARVDGNAAIRIAFQSNRPPSRVWVEPRLSLNRDPIRLDLPNLQNYTPTSSPILPYTSTLNWKPSSSNEIIVDDLDDGFSIKDSSRTSAQSDIPSWVEYLAGVPKLETDRGLPIRDVPYHNNPLSSLFGDAMSARRDGWFRDNDPSSYGKYRRTFAGKQNGLDQTRATYSVSLPSAGRWKLEYHLPVLKPEEIPNSGIRSPTAVRWHSYWIRLGTHKIRVRSGDFEADIELNAETAPFGWNDLGTFELQSGEARVVLSEVVNGLAIADAIRWTPMKEPN